MTFQFNKSLELSHLPTLLVLRGLLNIALAGLLGNWLIKIDKPYTLLGVFFIFDGLLSLFMCISASKRSEPLSWIFGIDGCARIIAGVHLLFVLNQFIAIMFLLAVVTGLAFILFTLSVVAIVWIARFTWSSALKNACIEIGCIFGIICILATMYLAATVATSINEEEILNGIYSYALVQGASLICLGGCLYSGFRCYLDTGSKRHPSRAIE